MSIYGASIVEGQNVSTKHWKCYNLLITELVIGLGVTNRHVIFGCTNLDFWSNVYHKCNEYVIRILVISILIIRKLYI